MQASTESDPKSRADAGAEDRRAIAGRAGVVAAGTLTSRVLGLARDQVFAGVFGRAETDAFFIAFTIPNVLRQLLAEGAVQNAVLPVMAAERERGGDEAAKRFYAAVSGLSLLVLVLVTAAGVFAAPALVELFAAGFHRHAGQFERTVELTRWVFPYIFFMGTAAMGVAALNANGRFAVTAFAPGLLNVAFIVTAAVLPAWLGANDHDRILAMAAGALVGGVLQVVAQWPALRAIGFFVRPRLDLRDPGVRAVLHRMSPVLVGIGIYYVDTVLARRFLSELDVGSQSYFGWAMRLCDLPQGVFVMALSSATLPSLAALAARGDHVELAKTFAFGMRLALFAAVSATALFVALAEPLVVMLFQRGEFDAAASHETARALVAQGLGIWMVASVRQLVGVYYAVGDTRTPVIVSALDLGVFVALALALRGTLGHVGVSFAVTGASAAQMLLLWLGLRRRVTDLRTAEIAVSVGKTLIAAIAAALAGRGAARALGTIAGSGAVARMLPGAAGLTAFAVVFVATARLVRSEELTALVETVSNRARNLQKRRP